MPLQPEDPREWRSQAQELRATETAQRACPGGTSCDEDPDIIRYEQFELESMAGPWIIHPHGDGHHSLHHLWSSVPHHQIAKMHQTLADLDRDNFAADIQWPKMVLENVRTGLNA